MSPSRPCTVRICCVVQIKTTNSHTRNTITAVRGTGLMLHGDLSPCPFWSPASAISPYILRVLPDMVMMTFGLGKGVAGKSNVQSFSKLRKAFPRRQTQPSPINGSPNVQRRHLDLLFTRNNVPARVIFSALLNRCGALLPSGV
jgi:hypothetical protein